MSSPARSSRRASPRRTPQRANKRASTGGRNAKGKNRDVFSELQSVSRRLVQTVLESAVGTRIAARSATSHELSLPPGLQNIDPQEQELLRLRQRRDVLREMVYEYGSSSKGAENIQFSRNQQSDNKKKKGKAAVAQSEVDSLTDDQVLERTAELQRQLFEVAMSNSETELMNRAVERVPAALQAVWADSDAAGSSVAQRQLPDLLRLRDAKVSEFLQMCETALRVDTELASVRASSAGLAQENRDIWHILQQQDPTLSDYSQLSQTQDDDPTLRKAKEERQVNFERNQIIRGVFLALVIESGLNWAEDNVLQDLVMTLDDPVV